MRTPIASAARYPAICAAAPAISRSSKQCSKRAPRTGSFVPGRRRFGVQAEQCIELLLTAVQRLGRLNDQVFSEAELAEQLDCLA